MALARPWRAAVAALLLATPLPARATLAPDARPVVEHYLAATGGGAALEHERTMHSKGTIRAFGLTGSNESWTKRWDKHAAVTALGPFRLRTGADGNVAWKTDPSGKLIMLDGKDLEEEKSDLYFETDRWLAPDQGGGTVASAGRDSSGANDVLEITPPTGKPRRLYFDRTSGLLVRMTSKHDQQTLTTFFSDYRKVGERVGPWRTLTQIAGMNANDITLTLDSAWVNEDMADARFAPPSEAAASARYLGTPGVAKLPFEYASRHVWLKVSINGGPPADFLYDTGASITVIDSAYAAKIGLVTEGRQQGQGAGATGSAAFSSVQSIRVATDGDGVELKDQKVAVLSINPFLAPYFWRDAAGVLGFDFIDRFVNQIDYDHHVLTLYDPATFTYAGKGARVPMTLSGHLPVVPMKLDGRYEGQFRVDVGSNSTVDLHSPFVKQNALAEHAGRTLEVSGGGFGGTFKARLRRMEKIEIGPYAWTRPIVSLSEAESGAFTSEDYAGNIGNQLLERFIVTLDYEHRMLYLEPGEKYAKADQFSRAGVQLARFGDTIQVMSVLAGSPAEKAGLRESDRVVTIDGQPVLSLTPDRVSDAFDRAAVGSRHRIGIRRDGHAKTLQITLRDML